MLGVRCRREREREQRGVMSRGHQPPDAATPASGAGRREKLIKTGFQTLSDDNISARPPVAPGPGFDLTLLLFRPGRVWQFVKYFSPDAWFWHKRWCEIVFIICEERTSKTRLDYGVSVPSCIKYLFWDWHEIILSWMESLASPRQWTAPSLQRKPGLILQDRVLSVRGGKVH